jgi:hypothetical protein
MANFPRERHQDMLAWAPGADGQERLFGDATWWLTGGATLLVWTAIALVLTSA